MGLRSSHSAPMAIEERLVSCAMSVNLLTSAPVFYSRSQMWIITWWASYCHSLYKISLCVKYSKYVCVSEGDLRERDVYIFSHVPRWKVFVSTLCFLLSCPGDERYHRDPACTGISEYPLYKGQNDCLSLALRQRCLRHSLVWSHCQ